MKKVLFLTSRLPLPADDGRSVTLKQYLDMLSSECEVGIVTLKGKKNKNEQAPYLKFVEELEYPSFVGKLTNVMFMSMIGGYPLQVAGVYSKKSQKKFNKIVTEFKPDIIICDMIRTSKYLKKCKYECTKVLDMDDVLSKRYRSSIEAKEDPLGQFKDMLPSFALKIMKLLHCNSLLLKMESKRMVKHEINSVRYFDKVILVSPKEVDELSKITNSDKIFSWPVCVEEKKILSNLSYDKNQICFLGNMDASQNQGTLKYICEKILPKLDKKYHLLVVGKCNENNKNMFREYPRVRFTGFVDSVDEFIHNSLCLLAPIQYGSGIKIKILESMALGLPVITSTIGAEGLSVENGKELFVLSNEDEYVKAIDKLQNVDTRERMIKESLNYVNNNHSFTLGKKIMKEKLLEA